MQALSSYVRRFLKEDDGSQTLESAVIAAVAGAAALEVGNTLKDGVTGLAKKVGSFLGGI